MSAVGTVVPLVVAYFIVLVSGSVPERYLDTEAFVRCSVSLVSLSLFPYLNRIRTSYLGKGFPMYVPLLLVTVFLATCLSAAAVPDILEIPVSVSLVFVPVYLVSDFSVLKDVLVVKIVPVLKSHKVGSSYVTSLIYILCMFYMMMTVFVFSIVAPTLATLAVFSVVVVAGTVAGLLYERRTDSFRRNAYVRHGSSDTSVQTVHESTMDSVRVRLLDYFEKQKPYLNPDIKITDVAHAIFTNKTYISKILNDSMDISFTSFVNRYRIKEAVRQFREDTELKVSELYSNSGFNNLPSFNTAFKINMGMTPSEWCRRTREEMRAEERRMLEVIGSGRYESRRIMSEVAEDAAGYGKEAGKNTVGGRDCSSVHDGNMEWRDGYEGKGKQVCGADGEDSYGSDGGKSVQ